MQQQVSRTGVVLQTETSGVYRIGDALTDPTMTYLEIPEKGGTYGCTYDAKTRPTTAQYTIYPLPNAETAKAVQKIVEYILFHNCPDKERPSTAILASVADLLTDVTDAFQVELGSLDGLDTRLRTCFETMMSTLGAATAAP